MTHIGYVGLGMMGGHMVERLLQQEHAVTGHNRTRGKAEWLLERGMRWAATPREAVAAADVTFSMVTSSAALRAIAEGPDGLLAGITHGKILVDMSTVSPKASRELAQQVRARGGDMLDAPVSGTVITLQQGKLSIMVGGRRESFDRAKPILEDIGPRVTYVGGNGLGLALKIAINLSLAVQMLAFSEGILLAEKSGVAREVAVNVLSQSAIASPMIIYRGPFVLQLPQSAWFDVNMMQKDMLLAMEMGRELAVPLPTTTLTNEFLTSARAMGLEKEDFAVMFDVLAAMSGVKR